MFRFSVIARESFPLALQCNCPRIKEVDAAVNRRLDQFIGLARPTVLMP